MVFRYTQKKKQNSKRKTAINSLSTKRMKTFVTVDDEAVRMNFVFFCLSQHWPWPRDSITWKIVQLRGVGNSEKFQTWDRLHRWKWSRTMAKQAKWSRQVTRTFFSHSNWLTRSARATTEKNSQPSVFHFGWRTKPEFDRKAETYFKVQLNICKKTSE